jgi:hypothetical protein
METFLALASKTKEKATAQLIMDCLESNVYQFEPLLHHPTIQSFQGKEKKLLEIFTTGTIHDLESFDGLSAKQIFKLKQLTLISKANEKQLFYDNLLVDLKISNIRELEDLIIQTIEQGLLVATLDQKRKCVYIESAMGRMNIDMIDILTKWYDNTGLVLRSIDEQILKCEQEVKMEEDLEKKYQDALKLVLEKKSASGGVAGGSG